MVVLAVMKYLKPPVVQPDLICVCPRTSGSGNVTAIVPEVHLLSPSSTRGIRRRSCRKYPAPGEAAALNAAQHVSEFHFWKWQRREEGAGAADPASSASPFLKPRWRSWRFLPTLT